MKKVFLFLLLIAIANQAKGEGIEYETLLTARSVGYKGSSPNLMVVQSIGDFEVVVDQFGEELLIDKKKSLHELLELLNLEEVLKNNILFFVVVGRQLESKDYSVRVRNINRELTDTYCRLVVEVDLNSMSTSREVGPSLEIVAIPKSQLPKDKKLECTLMGKKADYFSYSAFFPENDYNKHQLKVKFREGVNYVSKLRIIHDLHRGKLKYETHDKYWIIDEFTKDAKLVAKEYKLMEEVEIVKLLYLVDPQIKKNWKQ